MSAPIKDIVVEFNNGLGMYPVSLNIDFYNDEPVSINDIYNNIKNYTDISDIIFRNNTEVNTEPISWVIP